MNELTLYEPFRGTLDDFIAQAEAAGVGPADEDEVAAALARVIKQPRSDQIEHRVLHLAVVRPESELAR